MNSIRESTESSFQFYNDLTPLLLRLQQKASDFCFARKTEKEDLMKDLQQNIISKRFVAFMAALDPPGLFRI